MKREATVIERTLHATELVKTYKTIVSCRLTLPIALYYESPPKFRYGLFTYYHVLLHSPRFVTAFRVFHLHRDCRGKCIDSLKSAMAST